MAFELWCWNSVRQRCSRSHESRFGCKSVDARVTRTVSKRLKMERTAACWRARRDLVRKLGKSRPRNVEVGSRMERRWPRKGVGRESCRVRTLAKIERMVNPMTT
jgi:hypothetical protein